jgi:hypothetical protein
LTLANNEVIILSFTSPEALPAPVSDKLLLVLEVSTNNLDSLPLDSPTTAADY